MPGLTGKCTCGHVEPDPNKRGMEPVRTYAFDLATDPQEDHPIVTVHLFDGHPCYVEPAA